MYQEDMINEGDGCGGMPIQPKISIHGSVPESSPAAVVSGRASLEDVPDDEAQYSLPYNGSELSSDRGGQRQYHQYPGRLQLPPNNNHEDSTENVIKYTRSDSFQRHHASVEKSSSRDSNHNVHSKQQKLQEDYVLMPERKSRSKKRRQSHSKNDDYDDDEDLDDQYMANVALSIQCAMLFFCILILIAIIMSVFSIQGYVVVVVVCLVVLVSLLVGLCTFVYQVINEDDAPRVNSKHMPKWYKSLTKIVKDEITNFKEDWRNMYDGLYLLEDGDAGTVVNENGGENTGNKDKPKKKRKGKSAVFKMIAKPAAVFLNYRRKRKDKKKQKKAEKAAAESYFPPIV